MKIKKATVYKTTQDNDEPIGEYDTLEPAVATYIIDALTVLIPTIQPGNIQDILTALADLIVDVNDLLTLDD